MVPIPYDGGRRSTDRGSTASGFACPACSGNLQRTNGSVRCGSCGYVPRHGAD